MYQTTRTQTTRTQNNHTKKKLRFKKRSKRKPAIPRRKQHKSVARKYKGGEPLPFDFNSQLKETNTNTPYLIEGDTDLTKAYYLECPEAETKRTNTYFVFEKTYDCSSMYGKTEIVVEENASQNRWMAVNKRGAISSFGRSGCYNLYDMIQRLESHHVYMVYVVETTDTADTDEGETPLIEQWFKSNTIDGTKIHITMLAFVPKQDYDKKHFAIHYYIDKDMWDHPNPIRGLGMMLHGFSATMVRHITGKKDIRIVSAPNHLMLDIMKRDMDKHPDYYELDYELDMDTADTQGFSTKITNDYAFDENENQIDIGSLENFNFATGVPISIHSARLENRFKAIYNSFASKCKTEYSKCRQKPAPPGYLENIVNVSDSLEDRKCTINVLKKVLKEYE